MNVYDCDAHDRRAGAATATRRRHDLEDADLVLLNTCHIREKAAEKVYSALGRLRDMKKARAKEGREFMIGVTGCVAQAEGEEILRRAPAVDLVDRPADLSPPAGGAAQGAPRTASAWSIPNMPLEDKFEHLPSAEKAAGPARAALPAFLTVQEGCDKFCTFCVVPYTRGSEVSRPVRQIVDEAKKLVEGGVREITLLGQNVNAWHGVGPNGRSVGARRSALSGWRRFPGLRVCATPPAIRATWTTALIDGPPRPARRLCPTCICRCSPAPTAS